jgi:hypothetical protein
LVIGPRNPRTACEKAIVLPQAHKYAFTYNLARPIAEDDVFRLANIKLRKAINCSELGNGAIVRALRHFTPEPVNVTWEIASQWKVS